MWCDFLAYLKERDRNGIWFMITLAGLVALAFLTWLAVEAVLVLMPAPVWDAEQRILVGAAVVAVLITMAVLVRQRPPRPIRLGRLPPLSSRDRVLARQRLERFRAARLNLRPLRKGAAAARLAAQARKA